MTTKSAKNLRDDATEERAHRGAGTDPAEMENLAAAPAHAARVTELSAQLATGWRGALPQ